MRGSSVCDKQASEKPVPAMRREPLPIVATAGFLLVHPAFAQSYTIPDLLDGRLTQTVKGVNAFWRFLVVIFLFLLCRELFPDWRVAIVMALLCLIASELFFLSRPGIVDRMYTELPEVALMLLASWSAVRFVHGKTKARALWLGVALGLLALCKAAFLYIGFGFILLLFVTDRAEHFRATPGKSAWRLFVLTYAVIALAMFATIAPWVARNAIIFGKPQIAAGTDVTVLGTRMLLTEHTLLGQLYLYSPYALKQRVFGPLTGYSEDDLKPGGRLAADQRRRKRTGARPSTSASKLKDIKATGQKWVKGKAFNYVVEHPLRYVASIPVFAYKGMWFMTRAGTLLNLLSPALFLWRLFRRPVHPQPGSARGVRTGRRVVFLHFDLHSRFDALQPADDALRHSFRPLAYRRTGARGLSPIPSFSAISSTDACGLIQPASEANSSSQRRPTAPTSSAETASRA